MSQRHPGARKAKHHDEDPDDFFIAKVLEVGNWARSNQQVLTILGVLVAIGIAGAIYYASFRRTHLQQAAQEMEAIHETLSLEDREGARGQLSLFIQRFGGTPYEGEARLLLGELYLSTNDAQQAQTVLEPLGSSPRRPIEFQAAALLGAAYEQQSRWSDAEAVYLRIADRAELDFQVRDALESAARLRAGHGNPSGAIELYQRVLAGLDENSPEHGLYQMRIEELKAAANI